ncbi:hypothetical protein ACFOU0_10775 [Salinicoccus sesuvii]|uniref:Lipoprotein n=1 Tax=Salinicoccus sesuvii TaxID=868281 RepID=A0ABV7N700_9STAP
MSKKTKLLMVPFFVLALAACSDDTAEIDETEVEEDEAQEELEEHESEEGD